MKVYVVIPAFQEESAVGEAVCQAARYADAVLVADDGSTDNTYAAARAAGAQVVRHQVNRGYGAALVTGTSYAFTHGADIVVHFDADGQFEAGDIPALVSALQIGIPSVALGSRFLGKTIGITFIRLLTLKLAIIFTWAMSGLKLTDTHNGFRAFTREAWEKMNLQQDRMAFSSEFIDEIARHKIIFQEVPITVHYTEYSKKSSKQGSLPVLKILKDLFLGKFVK